METRASSSRSSPRTPSCDCCARSIEFSQQPLRFEFGDQFENSSIRFALHGLVIVEIPLHDELAVAIDMYVTRRMITFPGDEHVATSAVFTKPATCYHAR